MIGGVMPCFVVLFVSHFLGLLDCWIVGLLEICGGCVGCVGCDVRVRAFAVSPCCCVAVLLRSGIGCWLLAAGY